MKILVWLLLIILVILAIRKNSRASIMKYRKNSQQGFPHQENQAQSSANGSTDNIDEKVSEEMVCCADCKVYVPVSEAIIKNGVSFCSLEHAQKHT